MRNQSVKSSSSDGRRTIVSADSPIYFYFFSFDSHLAIFISFASLIMFPSHKDGRILRRKSYALNAMNRTCPSKWRIKKPFITCTRAGAAKKAAGCGGEVRGVSLSYLEPFPVNLGPPFVVVVLRTCMHTLARSVQRECTHARARAPVTA